MLIGGVSAVFSYKKEETKLVLLVSRPNMSEMKGKYAETCSHHQNHNLMNRENNSTCIFGHIQPHLVLLELNSKKQYKGIMHCLRHSLMAIHTP